MKDDGKTVPVSLVSHGLETGFVVMDNNHLQGVFADKSTDLRGHFLAMNSMYTYPRHIEHT